MVSRTHPGLIKRLFELEVPEIADGIVEIKACAREPGHRTKIAVWSNDHNVDPVGACVGARGARVRMVVNELRGEKIDIVPFSEDPPDFVMKALSPAKVKEVRIDEDTGTAEVIVPDYQLSLAIGKEGQNARLAARLTGWRVDIKSETQLADEEAYGGEEWAQGEWVVDPETGEQVWQPAEGGPALSATEWQHLGEDDRRARPTRSRPPRWRCPTTPPSPAARPTSPRSSSPRPPRKPPCTSRPRRRSCRRPEHAGRRFAAIRTCVGCRRRGPQGELTRVARARDGSLAVGRTLPGRGAWLCAGSLRCFELAVRARALPRRCG